MGLFRKKKTVEDTTPLNYLENPTENDSLVEIVAHQDAKKEIIDEARAVNANLKELLVNNGFTIKIYLAAGHTPTKSKEKKTND